jgi:hypothetical protein
MHRSSESIAALAAALAKAQIVLTNPEKSMTGTVPSNRYDEALPAVGVIEPGRPPR